MRRLARLFSALALLCLLAGAGGLAEGKEVSSGDLASAFRALEEFAVKVASGAAACGNFGRACGPDSALWRLNGDALTSLLLIESAGQATEIVVLVDNRNEVSSLAIGPYFRVKSSLVRSKPGLDPCSRQVVSEGIEISSGNAFIKVAIEHSLFNCEMTESYGDGTAGYANMTNSDTVVTWGNLND